MTDLISRKAAIEVLRNRWLKTRNYEGIGEDIAEECEIYLKTLPSAQPKKRTEERTETHACDLISRQAAIDALHSVDEYNSRSVKAIKQLPPIQPKRGRWVLVCDNNGMHFICNKCGAWRYHQEQKFCGECGADMRGEQNEP